MDIEIEQGVEKVVGHCDSCGHETRLFRGFASIGGTAHAMYLGRYTEAHPEFGVLMVVSIHGWGTGADPSLKECVALEWRNTATGPGCAVTEAQQSPWAKEAILGRMLTRAEALSSGRAKEAFLVTDAVWLSDERLASALTAS